MDYFGGDVIRKIRAPGRQKFPSGYVPSAVERINVVTEGTCLSILNEVVIPALSVIPPAFEGTGVVTCAGGPYLKLAYASISKLRELNADIPVQVWHLGEHEVEGHTHKFSHLNVDFRDCDPFFESEFYRTRTGWSAKSIAVKNSPFRQVLFIDADCAPIIDPETIFGDYDYREGMLCFPDGKQCRDSNRIFNALGIRYEEDFWEWEAGQFAVDKSVHWKAIQLYAWMNNHGYLFHRLNFGDKDGLPLACLKLRESFVTSIMPTWEGWGYQHYLSDGRPAFRHILHTKRHPTISPPDDIAELWAQYDSL